MAQVNIHEAKTHFSRLLERVRAGEEIVVAKAGKPVAKLVPYDEPESLPPREFGGWEGKVTFAPDFDDDAWGEEMARLFEGEDGWWPEDDRG
ncbi:MAG TPA: type II toxin-antitoxin system Phd/YefM family antitoxin [Gaiellaceae bacterium]|jgi:prevent-host-death family protein|nr:type II toxin-antitoxin system Phd/YefM family antitoxin [Gaiellaceae bacterium]